MQLTFAGGFYVSRGVIANVQRCVNLYPEKNPAQAPAPITLYLTPGTGVLAQANQQFGPVPGVARGGYYATSGSFYTVVGLTLYFVDSLFRYFPVGNMVANVTTPVSMIDNGNVLIVCDGSAQGYVVDLATNNFGQIIDPNWLGSTFVDYVDTFLLFNQPGTKNWYSSLSNVTFAELCQTPGQPSAGNIGNAGTHGNGTFLNVPLTGGTGTGATATITVAGGIVTVVALNPVGLGYVAGDALGAAGYGTFEYDLTDVLPPAFDPTYVASKTGFPDKISSIIVMHREIWLCGDMKTSEIWYDAGGANFPFQIIPGIFLEHGVLAPYSLKKYDLAVFFLGIDAAGVATVYMGSGYQITPVSTFAIAQEFSQYAVLSDAIGMVYKQQDHAFYILTFPTANKTWVLDITALMASGGADKFWHERTFTDGNGNENRILWNWVSQAYNKIVAGDNATGTLYEVRLDLYQDAVPVGLTLGGSPIVRRRGFDHLLNDGKRVTYDSFIADVECGDASLAVAATDTEIFLRWSDDRGKTFGTAVGRSLGVTGKYLEQPKWNQLGMARDRVFELFWSCPCDTSCDGGFLQLTPAGT